MVTLGADLGDRHEQVAGRPVTGVLDRKQVGSIRHIANLARQLPGDWSNMMGPTRMQEGFGSYKFQLAYGAYALALAHRHRLPAAPGSFKDVFQRLIAKLLEPDCWWGWRDESQGGGLVNAAAPMTEGQINPIDKDNIMYSAYVHTLPLMYNVLFDDDRYAQPGALTLKYNPIFWGGQKGHEFVYDQNSLNQRVYWNMVESGFIGVACEPHCVYLICNQVPIIGFRLHDFLNGGSIAEEVTHGYLKAWNEFGGLLDDSGSYKTVLETYTNKIWPAIGAWSDAWCGTLMNAWNPEFVKRNYEKQRDRWIVRDKDGLISIRLPEFLPREELAPGDSNDFGWMAMWASEMGDTETLNGMLGHADRYMSPRFVNGGYTAPRNDGTYDAQGRLINVHPAQSNALLPYARLNVPNGMHLFYTHPWGKEHFAEPALTDVSPAVDLYRAVYEDDVLLFDAALFEPTAEGEVLISRLFDRGPWELHRNGALVATGDDVRLINKQDSSVMQDGATLRIRIDGAQPSSYSIRWST